MVYGTPPLPFRHVRTKIVRQTGVRLPCPNEWSECIFFAMPSSQKYSTRERGDRRNGESHNVNGVLARLNIVGASGVLQLRSLANNLTRMLQGTTPSEVSNSARNRRWCRPPLVL
jgi:hypothetical protein